jgi:hypothetical protein
MAVKMAVVTNLVAVKGLQVAVNFGEGGSEGLPRSGNPEYHYISKNRFPGCIRENYQPWI